MPEEIEPIGVLPLLARNYSLVAVGEVHTEHSARGHLIQFMPEFSRLGGKYLFVEGCRCSQQVLLDDYFENPNRSIPIEVARWRASSGDSLRRLRPDHERPSHATTSELIEAAKKNGIRTIGLGDETAAIPTPLIKDGDRLRADPAGMKAYLYERAYLFLLSSFDVISRYKEITPTAGAISLTGQGHSAKNTGRRLDGIIPGIADVFDTVAVHYRDINTEPLPQDKTRTVETASYLDEMRRDPTSDFSHERLYELISGFPHVIVRLRPETLSM